MKYTPLLLLLILSFSEGNPISSHDEKRVDECVKVDAIVIPPNTKITLFFGDKADSMGIYGDGKGHVIRDGKSVEMPWTPADYTKIRSLCMDVINSSEVTNERIGGPGYDSISIAFGNAKVQASFMYGIVAPEEFPTSVHTLIREVRKLQMKNGK